ncbi:MAG: sortase [Lachnospiraceae bacterium]|nr:sortase [Lachnospiraceae bacterium]
MRVNKRKRGIVLIAFGIALIMAALGMNFFNAEQDRIAGETSHSLYESFAEEMRYVYPHKIEEDEKMELGGYSLLGSIEIASLDMRLPVLDSWSYDMLKIAPCRYSGSVDTADLIIMGHNYKSHFKSLESISEGVELTFTDIGGNEHIFMVAEMEMLDKTDIDKLDTKEYPLTLFTCNLSGQGRIVVRCKY